LMYIRNNNGPKFEPCGTPYFISVHFEIMLESWYELMICYAFPETKLISY
jgi:hypothetical protein